MDEVEIASVVDDEKTSATTVTIDKEEVASAVGELVLIDFSEDTATSTTAPATTTTTTTTTTITTTSTNQNLNSNRTTDSANFLEDSHIRTTKPKPINNRSNSLSSTTSSSKNSSSSHHFGDDDFDDDVVDVDDNENENGNVAAIIVDDVDSLNNEDVKSPSTTVTPLVEYYMPQAKSNTNGSTQKTSKSKSSSSIKNNISFDLGLGRSQQRKAATIVDDFSTSNLNNSSDEYYNSSYFESVDLSSFGRPIVKAGTESAAAAATTTAIASPGQLKKTSSDLILEYNKKFLDKNDIDLVDSLNSEITGSNQTFTASDDTALDTELTTSSSIVTAGPLSMTTTFIAHPKKQPNRAIVSGNVDTSTATSKPTGLSRQPQIEEGEVALVAETMSSSTTTATSQANSKSTTTATTTTPLIELDKQLRRFNGDSQRADEDRTQSFLNKINAHIITTHFTMLNEHAPTPVGQPPTATTTTTSTTTTTTTGKQHTTSNVTNATATNKKKNSNRNHHGMESAGGGFFLHSNVYFQSPSSSSSSSSFSNRS